MAARIAAARIPDRMFRMLVLLGYSSRFKECPHSRLNAHDTRHVKHQESLGGDILDEAAIYPAH